MEQKVDQMAADLTRRQQESEDTALQYKRYIYIAWGYVYVHALQYVAGLPILHCVGRRLMEQKVDQLTEMTVELTRRLQGWDVHGSARSSAYS